MPPAWHSDEWYSGGWSNAPSVNRAMLRATARPTPSFRAVRGRALVGVALRLGLVEDAVDVLLLVRQHDDREHRVGGAGRTAEVAAALRRAPNVPGWLRTRSRPRQVEAARWITGVPAWTYPSLSYLCRRGAAGCSQTTIGVVLPAAAAGAGSAAVRSRVAAAQSRIRRRHVSRVRS